MLKPEDRKNEYIMSVPKCQLDWCKGLKHHKFIPVGLTKLNVKQVSDWYVDCKMNSILSPIIPSPGTATISLIVFAKSEGFFLLEEMNFVMFVKGGNGLIWIRLLDPLVPRKQTNIVDLKGVFEDKHAVHLVMELCAGGELFDRIISKGHYTERAATSLLRTIVQIVHTCHSMGVIHRDLKPENFLLLSKDEDAPLKATDFDLSVYYKQGNILRDIVGSAYYIAPEILKRHYGHEVDIWSLGVMLYILLRGVPPFWAELDQGIFKAILGGLIDLSSESWPNISDGAKDLAKNAM